MYLCRFFTLNSEATGSVTLYVRIAETLSGEPSRSGTEDPFSSIVLMPAVTPETEGKCPTHEDLVDFSEQRKVPREPRLGLHLHDFAEEHDHGRFLRINRVKPEENRPNEYQKQDVRQVQAKLFAFGLAGPSGVPRERP